MNISELKLIETLEAKNQYLAKRNKLLEELDN